MQHEIMLSPARGGGRYRAIWRSEVLVDASRDPEHDAARALLAKGITGVMVTRWQGSSHLATRPRDIVTTANWSLIEARTGLHRSKWKPFPKHPSGTRKNGQLLSPATHLAKTVTLPLTSLREAGNRQL